MTLLRFALVPWTGESAPFAFVFVAVVGAAVLAGWRSGLLALLLAQLLAWFLIVDPAVSGIERLHNVGGFTVASLAQLMTLVIIALYQREVDRAWSRREAQVDLIHQALVEMDHRTTNNYQTVLSLVSAQAKHAEPSVKEALEQFAGRIRAIAMASKQLAVSSDNLATVNTSNHLGELCGELRQGLTRPGISIECHLEDISLGADETTWLSILMNELVTNALKHAFPDDREGTISVALKRTINGIELTVADNGIGMKPASRSRGNGLGTRLIQTFTRQLGARHEVDSGKDGTRHHIHIPTRK
jgi:two-component sensor histidine kinase